MSSRARIHSGYLDKEPRSGHMLSSKRRRFFVLRPGLLQWFENDTEDVRRISHTRRRIPFA